MLYIGIDLAWNRNNKSFVVILKKQNNNLNIISTKYLSFEDIIPHILSLTKNQKTIIALDAPIVIKNDTGNRQLEIDFLKDFSKYKLGIYPVNKSLFLKMYKSTAGVDLYEKLKKFSYKLGISTNKNIIEIYTHASIMTLYNNMKVLPYKYKKGRNKEFLIEQLNIYTSFLKQDINNINENIFEKRTLKTIKKYEDYLDSILCAYSSYLAYNYPKECTIYGNNDIGLLYVPKIRQ